MTDFAAWAAAAAIAAGSVALLENLRGPRAAWSLVFIIALSVFMTRDPGGAELTRLIATIFPPTPGGDGSGKK